MQDSIRATSTDLAVVRDADEAALAAVHGRDQTAQERDSTAQAHDKASEARDARADARDERADAREEAAYGSETAAASDRAGAKRDRQGGANDRKHAEHDRQAASTDRALSARERELFLVDGLTGVHRREAGTLELQRELVRATRTQQPYVLAFIDVDGLKATNDTLGHSAGDALLQHVVAGIRKHVRAYDLIVRYGGDEFLCGLVGLSKAEALARFDRVNADLAAAEHGSITAGLAELDQDETLHALIDRADAAMYQQRTR